MLAFERIYRNPKASLEINHYSLVGFCLLAWLPSTTWMFLENKPNITLAIFLTSILGISFCGITIRISVDYDSWPCQVASMYLRPLKLSNQPRALSFHIRDNPII